jgi:hypothetical protein
VRVAGLRVRAGDLGAELVGEPGGGCITDAAHGDTEAVEPTDIGNDGHSADLTAAPV